VYQDQKESFRAEAQPRLENWLEYYNKSISFLYIVLQHIVCGVRSVFFALKVKLLI
jgi:hypothetical protein